MLIRSNEHVLVEKVTRVWVQLVHINGVEEVVDALGAPSGAFLLEKVAVDVSHVNVQSQLKDSHIMSKVKLGTWTEHNGARYIIELESLGEILCRTSHESRSMVDKTEIVENHCGKFRREEKFRLGAHLFRDHGRVVKGEETSRAR